MRKITEKAVKAFVNGESFTLSNTRVSPSENGNYIYLWGNLIAIIREGKITIDNCGYQTNTTNERLNGILDYYNIGKLYTVNGYQYITKDYSYPRGKKKIEEALNNGYLIKFNNTYTFDI